MKTPEEIKKALEGCIKEDCGGCPYVSDCLMKTHPLESDALVYINYLEEHVEAYMRQSERVENLDLVSRSELLKKAGWYNLYGENRSIYAVSVKEIKETLPAYYMALRQPPKLIAEMPEEMPK